MNKALQPALKKGHPMLNLPKAKMKDLVMDLIDDYTEQGYVGSVTAYSADTAWEQTMSMIQDTSMLMLSIVPRNNR